MENLARLAWSSSSGFAKYAQLLKNSVASKETANERIFLMKDLAAVEEAVSLDAEKMEGDVTFSWP